MSEKIDEKKWLIIFSIALILITSLPFYLGFEIAKSTNTQFSGFIFGVEDGNSYIAKMLLGSNGDWFFRTPYTAYDQKGFLAFLPYLLLGKFAFSPENHIQLVVLFHLFRCLGIFFLVFEIYYFIQLFISSRAMIQVAVIISCVGGGLGWISIIANGNVPLEFYSPESFGFLSIFGLPHLCFSRGLMIRSFRMLLSPGKDILNLNRNFTSGLYLFASGLFQPLAIPLGWLLVGIWKLFCYISNRNVKVINIIKELIFYFLIPLPFFLYNALMFLFDPYLNSWESQNIIQSPPLYEYLLAYGFGYICLLFSVLYLKKQPHNKIFLFIWAAILPILIYLPINLQRRLADGFWVVLSIFITIFVYSFKKNYVRFLIIGLNLLSTTFLLIGSLNAVKNQQEPIFQSNELIEIFTEIKNSGEKNDVVLAPYEISNILPAYIPMRVVTGHGPESKNLQQIKTFIDFFDSGIASENQMQEFFKQFKIQFVIFKSSSPGIENFEDSFYEIKLFENSNYVLYQIPVIEDV